MDTNVVVDVIVPSCDSFHTQSFAVFFLGTFRETDLIVGESLYRLNIKLHKKKKSVFC